MTRCTAMQWFAGLLGLTCTPTAAQWNPTGGVQERFKNQRSCG